MCLPHRGVVLLPAFGIRTPELHVVVGAHAASEHIREFMVTELPCGLNRSLPRRIDCFRRCLVELEDNRASVELAIHGGMVEGGLAISIKTYVTCYYQLSPDEL